MDGLDFLGSDHAPLVDCVERGEAFARSRDAVGHGGGHKGHGKHGHGHGGHGFGGAGIWPYGPYPPYPTQPIFIVERSPFEGLDFLDVDDESDEQNVLEQRSTVVGAWSDGVTDYDYGETKVIQLVQFFNTLGRPKEFEPDVERVYAAYEKAKVWAPFGSPVYLSRWSAATKMKQIGADAAVLMDTIRASGAHGNGAVAASSKVPTQIENPVYTPGKNSPTSWTSWIPTWVDRKSTRLNSSHSQIS